MSIVVDGITKEPIPWTAADIIERIMSAHWDMAACPCWVCRQGRVIGMGPRECWLNNHHDNRTRFPVPDESKFGVQE